MAMSDAEQEKVIETATRLMQTYSGAKEAARKAREFSRFHTVGSADRKFWLAVAESIRDAHGEGR